MRKRKHNKICKPYFSLGQMYVLSAIVEKQNLMGSLSYVMTVQKAACLCVSQKTGSCYDYHSHWGHLLKVSTAQAIR